MLSSAALQKLERYAQIALAKCGVSATLAHAASEATAPISLSPFVSSSYESFSLKNVAGSAAGGGNNNNINNNNTNNNASTVDKGAMNRSVLLSSELWSQVAKQLTTANVTNTSAAPSASSASTMSDGLVIAVALSLHMIHWEVDHYIAPRSKPKAAAVDSALAKARVAEHASLLILLAEVLNAMSRDRAVESPSLTLAFATLSSVSINALLSNLLSTKYAASSASPPSAASSPAFLAEPLTSLLLQITELSAQQLRRAGAAYPLPKLFTVRVAAQQLKQLGSGLINALKDAEDAAGAAMAAVGKMRLLQRMGLLYGILRDYPTVAAAASADKAVDRAEACKDAIVDAASPYVATRTTRHHVYFRTEADESRLAMSGCTDIPTQVAAIDFVLTPPVDPEAVMTMKRMAQSPAAKAAIAVTLESWAASTQLVFVAFCRDGGWSVFAAEAKRRILAEQAAKKSKANKKALKEEEKEIQRQMKQKAMDALLKAKEEEHKEAMRLQRKANKESNAVTGKSGDESDGEHDGDNDDAKSAASGASGVSGVTSVALTAKSGVTANTATEMSRAESDVRSVMSAASFQSYATFLSVVDSEAIANEQRMQHESADGNTNLPIIFLELACLGLHQFLESVGGSGNNAFIMRPEGGDQQQSGLAILPLEVVEAVWSAISGLFAAFAAFIDAQPRTGLICFSLSEDVQYNKGLGYQSLGLLFARVLVPALLKERACSGAAEDAEVAAAIEALHVSQTLLIYERVASQAINQNLAAVLDMCCNALQPTATAAATAAAATSTTKEVLQRLLVTIVSRLGQTNQLGILLKAMVTDHEEELRKKNKEAAALKKLRGAEEADEDDDADEETAAARALAKKKAEAVDREMALRRTVLPFSSSLKLLRTPCFRDAFALSVRRSLDPEGLLETLGNSLAQMLLGVGGDDDDDNAAGDDDEEDADGGDDEAEKDGSEDSTVKAFRSLVHLKAPVVLGVSSLVFGGLLPTSLLAFNIFEKCAEIEAYLLMFLEGSLYLALRHAQKAKTEDDAEDEEEAPSNSFLLQYLLQSAAPSGSSSSKVRPKHLKDLFLCVSEALLILRDTMCRVCLKDLGVDQLEKVVAVMNESLWQVTELSNEADGAAEPRFITYEKDSALTLEALLETCVAADTSRSPISGVGAAPLFVRLAAQRLQLINSVGRLISEAKAEGSEGADYSFATAAKALALYVGQNMAVALEACPPGAVIPSPYIALTGEEWHTVAATVGPKRWRKYLTAATAALSPAAIKASSLPVELVTVLPVATLPSAEALTASDDGEAKAEAALAAWVDARARWRSLGCVPGWEETIPALAAAVIEEANVTAKAKASSVSASILQEALRLSVAAQTAYVSASTATASVFALFATEEFIAAIVALATTTTSSSEDARLLLIQLVSASTAAAPNGPTAPSAAFLTALYTYFTATVTSVPSVLSTLLSKAGYLLPSGAATNAHLAAPLKAFIGLGKAVLKAAVTAAMTAATDDTTTALVRCASLMLGKHLPVYCDAAGLAKLAAKARARMEEEGAHQVLLAAHGPSSITALLYAQLVAAGASSLATSSTPSAEAEAEAAADPSVAEAVGALLAAFGSAAAKKKGGVRSAAAATAVAVSASEPFCLDSHRPLWALAASQLLRAAPHTTDKEKEKEKASKSAATESTAADSAVALAATILAAIEKGLLSAVRNAEASFGELPAGGRGGGYSLEAALGELEALSATPRVRFTTFLPSVVALLAKVTTAASTAASTAATTPSTASIIARTLALARLPLASLLGEAQHQDATMNLLFTLASPPVARALPPSALAEAMATFTAYAAHRPIVLSRRAALLPSLFASLLTSIFAKLSDAEKEVVSINNTNNNDRSRSAAATDATANLLSTYNSTLAAVVRHCEFEAAVSSSSTPLTVGPATTPKGYVCCAIATAIFGVVSARRHLSLFARYSNELDYLAKDVIVEMLKGRLPLPAQRRLVDVVVSRDTEAEKAEREKLKKKQQREDADVKKTLAAEGERNEEEREKEEQREVGKKAARADDASGSEADENESVGDDDEADKMAALAQSASSTTGIVVGPSNSSSNANALIKVKKRYTIKRYRREPAAVRKSSEASFADLCYAALATSSSNDAQNLLRQEILRIRDEDGRAIFRPTN